MARRWASIWVDEIIGTTITQVHGEEISSTRDTVAAIVRHGPERAMTFEMWTDGWKSVSGRTMWQAESKDGGLRKRSIRPMRAWRYSVDMDGMKMKAFLTFSAVGLAIANTLLFRNEYWAIFASTALLAVGLAFHVNRTKLDTSFISTIVNPPDACKKRVLFAKFGVLSFAIGVLLLFIALSIDDLRTRRQFVLPIVLFLALGFFTMGYYFSCLVRNEKNGPYRD